MPADLAKYSKVQPASFDVTIGAVPDPETGVQARSA
jgi:hypothetical protein